MSGDADALAKARAYAARHGIDWTAASDADLAGELGAPLFHEEHGVVASAIFQGLVVEAAHDPRGGEA